MPGDPITPELVLRALTSGAFPMADARDGQIHWYSAEPRAILPLDDRFKVRRSLAKIIARNDFVITRDRAFPRVITACAQPRPSDDQTWISPQIIRVYCQLADMGYAHSVEAWQPHQDGRSVKLVGGLYGLAVGAAFFGESMFSTSAYASQVCLVHLVEHLRAHHFCLCDVQFTNPHLQQFGLLEIPKEDYLHKLTPAINQPNHWRDSCDDG